MRFGNGTCGAQYCLELVGRGAVGGREDGAGSNGDDADPQCGEIASGDQRHAHHPALRGRVRQLTDLALVRRDLSRS